MKNYNTQSTETEEIASEENESNITRRAILITGGIVILGGVGYGVASALGLVPNPFAKKEEVTIPETNTTTKPEPEPEKPLKIDAGTYIVGTDINPGIWRAYNFATNKKSYMTIKRSNTVYDLSAPESEKLNTLWASQALYVNLEDKDEVMITGTMEFAEDYQPDLKNTELLPALQAGLIPVGLQAMPGTWKVKPKNSIDEIVVEGMEQQNIPPYGVIKSNLDWQGRVLERISQVAKEEQLKQEDIDDTFRGVLIISQTDLSEDDSPFYYANLKFINLSTTENEESNPENAGTGAVTEDQLNNTEQTTDATDTNSSEMLTPDINTVTDTTTSETTTTGVVIPLIKNKNINAESETTTTTETPATTSDTATQEETDTNTTDTTSTDTDNKTTTETISLQTTNDDCFEKMLKRIRNREGFTQVKEEIEIDLNEGDWFMPILVDMEYIIDDDSTSSSSVAKSSNSDTQSTETPSDNTATDTTTTTTDTQTTTDTSTTPTDDTSNTVNVVG